MLRVCLLGVMLTACADAASAPEEDPEPPAETTSDDVELSLHFKQLGGSPLVGVEVCWRGEEATCADTGANGEATFLVPRDTLGVVTVQGDEVAPAAHPLTVLEADVVLTFTEAPLALAEQTFEALGVGVDREQGLLLAFVDGGAQVTAELEPTAGDGPYYLSPLGLPLIDAEALPEGGGAVAYFNLPEGEYTIELSDARCAFSNVAWPGPRPHVASAPSLAGFGTAIRSACEE